VQRAVGEVRENLNRAHEAITASDRQPVIVVDGSDGFTRRHRSGRAVISASARSSARCCARSPNYTLE
jgi:hypothetical protein